MNSNYIHPRIAIDALAIVFLVMLTACGTQSRKAAGEGAVTGAAVGAVGGVVSALVFGGDPAESAARGAVWGASTGAAAGAIAGARADDAQQAQRDADLERLKLEIGEDSYNGLEALTDCKHEIALAYARTAARSDNKNYALAGLWLEALAYADSRQEDQARVLFSKLVEKDSKIYSEAQAEESMRKALQKLMDIRAEYNLPRVCG